MGLPWLLLLSGAAVTWDGDHPLPERLPVAMGHSWRGGTTQKVLTFWVTQAKMPLQESPSQVSKLPFLENSLSGPPAAGSAHSSPPPLPKVICTIPSFEGHSWLERVGAAEDSRQAPRCPRTVLVGAQGCVTPHSPFWPFPCPGPRAWSFAAGVVMLCFTHTASRTWEGPGLV